MVFVPRERCELANAFCIYGAINLVHLRKWYEEAPWRLREITLPSFEGVMWPYFELEATVAIFLKRRFVSTGLSVAKERCFRVVTVPNPALLVLRQIGIQVSRTIRRDERLDNARVKSKNVISSTGIWSIHEL